MVTTKTLRLDVTKKYTEPIYLVQYEVDARILDIYLSAGSLPINLTGASVVFYAKKPDGTILFNNCTVVDAVSGHVVYTVTEQMCAVAGDLRCWILVIKDDAELRSIEFKVTVQPSEDDTEAIESTSEFTALETALSTVGGLDGRMTAAEEGIDALDGRMTDAESGWISVSDTWTYASSTTITVPPGAASKYKKGDKIKLTQTTVKYFYIVAVADTLLTITGGTTYTLVDAPITDVYYSHVANPVGFPAYLAYSPSVSAASGSSTFNVGVARFSVLSAEVFLTIELDITSAGSGTGDIRIPLPVNNVGYAILAGRENAVNGKMLQGKVELGTLYVCNFDNSTPIVNGASLKISGTYRI